MGWSRSVYNQGRLPAAPGAGDKAQRYISSFHHRLKILGAASLGCGEAPSRLIGASIPDRSPGHAFVPMTTWAVVIVAALRDYAHVCGPSRHTGCRIYRENSVSFVPDDSSIIPEY